MNQQQFLTKFQLTINNPYTETETKEKYLNDLNSLNPEYYCYSEETGEEGTFHIHIYAKLYNQVRFTTLKNLFPRSHIEKANGSSSENRDYVFKIGKWENTEKKTTNNKDSHVEFGSCPENDKQGKRNDLTDMYNMVASGLTNAEILSINPRLCVRLSDMDRVRITLLQDKYKSTLRFLNVTYIYGDTGTGKTRGVFEKHGYERVYRITDYKNPWDGYACEPVIVFEEFRSQLKIEDMLNYLDIYPLSLPCRYANKQACFTQVYIISNWTLSEQYKNIQIEYPLTYDALKRRITDIVHYQKEEEPKNMKILLKAKQVSIYD